MSSKLSSKFGLYPYNQERHMRTTDCFNRPSICHVPTLYNRYWFYLCISKRAADDMVWHTDFMSVHLGFSLTHGLLSQK